MMFERPQRGAALLAVVSLLVAMVALAAVYSRGAVQQRVLAQGSVHSDMVFAREALIDYSVNYPSHYPETGAGPGHLPCPDTSGNGSPELSCGVAPMGLMPLDFLAGERKQISLLSGDNNKSEPLWYALSGAFRYNPVPSGKPLSATIVNSDTQAELALDGEAGIIALLIAPGPPLQGQEREGSLAVEDYLEGDNADGDRSFRSDQGNDRFLALRWDDLMPLVERRVLESAVRSVSTYVAEYGHMPWLAPVANELIDGATVCSPCQWRGWLASERYRGGGAWPPFSQQSCAASAGGGTQAAIDLPIWFVRNYWHRQLWLHVSADDRDGLCPSALNPIYEGIAVAAVLSTVGRSLALPQHGRPQTRASATSVFDYLDSDDWTDGDAVYGPVNNSSVNDLWAVLP